VSFALAALQTHGLHKLVAVLRSQRQAALSGALRKWLLAWLHGEAAFVCSLPATMQGLLVQLVDVASAAHSAAAASDAAATAAEAETTATRTAADESVAKADAQRAAADEACSVVSQHGS
tara:strand:- start:847 stop:1206 length:360 start_codon:yes stop_codon:yes gene_type:complete